MYTVNYKCLICHEIGVKHYHTESLTEVEFDVDEISIGIAMGNICCGSCGQICPMEVVILDDAHSCVVSEKIISPYHYGNYDIFDCNSKPNVECDLCNGNGYLDIAKKAHKDSKTHFIEQGDCPLCCGKGYLELGGQ